MNETFVTKGVLTLVGKRLTGHLTEDVPTAKADGLSSVVRGGQTLIYVDLSVIEQLKLRGEMFLYYENGQILSQTMLTGALDKTVIAAETDEFATYTVASDEPMQFMITQVTGFKSSSSFVDIAPVDGVIRLEVDSKVPGRVKVFGQSDRYYTNEVELEIQ